MALRQTPLTCSGHTRPVVDLAFSDITPYGYFMISACKDGKPMLRQGETGDWIGTFLGHKGAVWGATLNSDATRGATAAADFTAKVWDAVSGDEVVNFTHKHIVKTVHFTGDSTKLLTGGQDKILRIYDLENHEADPKELSGHHSGVRKAVWCNNDSQILSVADDKTVSFATTSHDIAAKTFCDCGFDPICKLSNLDFCNWLWDARTLEEVKSLDLPVSVSGAEYQAEGEILVLTYGRTIAFYNALSLELVKSFDAPARINSASLHLEKDCVVAGGDDFKLYKFDYATGDELESYKGHFGQVHCVRFSPDGELYASGSEDGTLRLWQTTVGKTYGLWKCVLPDELNAESVESSAAASQDVKA